MQIKTALAVQLYQNEAYVRGLLVGMMIGMISAPLFILFGYLIARL